MTDIAIARRTLLLSLTRGAAALVATSYSHLAGAQDAPAANLSAAGLQRQLAALEQRARALGLPETRSSRRPAVRLNNSNAYRESMPRLIELVERSDMGTRSAEVGEGAAELLGRLHRLEYGWARSPGPGLDDRAGRAPTLDSLRSEYRRMFGQAQVRSEYRSDVAWHVGKLRRDRARYEAFASEVQIPWYFIGIIHGLEASFNFMGHLHNGDAPLTKRTRNVPSNRPEVWLPPADWESSAKDALAYDGFLGQTDWSLEAMLYRWEAYNGWGYRHSGRPPTPYLWSFSNHYSRGKFASDGRYEPQLKSQQCGAAIMLKELLNAGDIAQL